MPLSPACEPVEREFFTMSTRVETNWLEEHLPIPWGGLQVFLWSLVFLLEGSLMMATLTMYPEFPFKEHVLVCIVLTVAFVHMAYRCVQIIWFVVSSRINEKPKNFAWMRKYLRNNLSGVPLDFRANVNQQICMTCDKSTRYLRQEGVRLRTERVVDTTFSIRCGGWFFRKEPQSRVYYSVDMDFRAVFKIRNSVGDYFLRYENGEVLKFTDFYQALDHLVTHAGEYPSVVLHRHTHDMQEQLTKIESLIAQVTELYCKHDHSSRWVDMEFNVIFQIYRQIIHHLKQNHRVAENLTANSLIRAILSQIIELCEEIDIDSSCTYVQIPQTAMKRVSEEEVRRLTEIYNKKNPKSPASPPAQTERTD